MPAQYGDFSKSVTDILTDDFGEKKFLKTKFTTPAIAGNGVTVTSEVALTGYSGKLSGKWKHGCGFSFDKLSLDSKGAKYEASFDKVYKGVVLKATGDVSMARPLSTFALEYSDSLIASTIKSDAKLEGTAGSVVMGKDNLSVGAAFDFKQKGGLTDYPLSIGYGDAGYFVAVSAEDKLQKFGLAAKYDVNDSVTLAFNGQTGLDFNKGSHNKMEVGAVYTVDSATKAKVKYAFVDGQTKGNNPGSLELAINSTPLKKVNVTCGIAFPADFSTHKFGAGITLG